VSGNGNITNISANVINKCPVKSCVRCMQCNRNFKNKVALNMHQMQVHRNSNILRDFLHNCGVMESGEGELIVGHEPNEEMTVREKIDAYLARPYCRVLYLKHDLWRHAKRCRFRTVDDTTLRNIVGKSRMMRRGALNQDSLNMDEKFKCEILEGM